MRYDRYKKAIIYLLLVLILTIVIYPLIWILINSFKSTKDFLQNSFTLPATWHFENYVKAWNNGLSKYFLNSMLISLLSILLITGIASLATYGLTRFQFRFRNALFLFILAGLSLSIESSFVPLFKMFQTLHLYNKQIGVIILYTAFRIPITVFLMRSYFLSFPREVEEAAMIDGCGPFAIYWRIFLPIGRPILASSAIVNLIFTWNEFMTALIFLEDQDLMTIPVGLNALKGEMLQEWNIQLAAVVIASLPLVLIYLCMQKSFVKGLTAGSVKG